jgi:hypothetical protein
MDGAGDARIKGMDGAQDFERLVGLDDGVADQRRFVRTCDAFLVAR